MTVLVLRGLMEQALYNDYKTAQDEGKTNNRWWFDCRAKQLVKEFYPDESFKASDQWFSRFTNRFEVSLHRKTHSYSIAKFHSRVLRI